jgi:ubiquinone/menaquinone biosynthesis C-methylase UbiE
VVAKRQPRRFLVVAGWLRAYFADMTTGTDWQTQVGRTWADNYRLTDRSFTALTARLIARAGAAGGDAVLDVGCGAGELALALAAQDHAPRVIGLDVSPDLIAMAQQRAKGAHPAPEFVLGDAANWILPGFAPDLIVSRHGVMFFDDPVAAFAHLRAIAAPGAALVFSCFRAPAENPWASTLAQLLDQPLAQNPRAPGPFAFADRAYVESILHAAGWQDIAFEAVNFGYIAGQGADPIADALDFFARIGPAAPTLRALDAAGRVAAEAKIRDWLEPHRVGDQVVLQAAAWIVSAQRG